MDIKELEKLREKALKRVEEANKLYQNAKKRGNSKNRKKPNVSNEGPAIAFDSVELEEISSKRNLDDLYNEMILAKKSLAEIEKGIKIEKGKQEESTLEEPTAEEEIVEATPEEIILEEEIVEATPEEIIPEEEIAEETSEEPTAKEEIAEETSEEPTAKEEITEETSEEPTAEQEIAEETSEKVNTALVPISDKETSLVEIEREPAKITKKDRSKRTIALILSAVVIVTTLIIANSINKKKKDSDKQDETSISGGTISNDENSQTIDLEQLKQNQILNTATLAFRSNSEIIVNSGYSYLDIENAVRILNGYAPIDYKQGSNGDLVESRITDVYTMEEMFNEFTNQSINGLIEGKNNRFNYSSLFNKDSRENRLLEFFEENYKLVEEGTITPEQHFGDMMKVIYGQDRILGNNGSSLSFTNSEIELPLYYGFFDQINDYNFTTGGKEVFVPYATIFNTGEENGNGMNLEMFVNNDLEKFRSDGVANLAETNLEDCNSRVRTK